MSIPKARERIRELADLLYSYGGVPVQVIDTLEEIEGMMYRKSPVSRAKPRIRKLTPALAEAIRATWNANPELSQLEIARIHDTNPGRVSEALNWKV